MFGGTFDPVHNGHLSAGLSAIRQLNLDQIRLIPVCQQPLKRSAPVTSANDRVAMLELATEDQPAFVVDLREIDRGGLSYTADTIAELRMEFLGDELFLLLGSDAAKDFSRWRDTSEIERDVQLVILTRPGSETMGPILSGIYLEVPLVDVSSSMIRTTVRRGGVIDEMVPASVASYIHDRGLYQSDI